MQGVASQERAGKRLRSRGGQRATWLRRLCGEGHGSLTWGDLALGLKGRRPKGKSEKSAEAILASRRGQALKAELAKGREEGRATPL